MATWNIQGLNTKCKEVFEEIKKLSIDICVLSETKKKGTGNEIIGEYVHFYSGVSKAERAKRGVSIAVHKKWRNNISSWEEINERIILVELEIRGHQLVIVGVYAPTDDADFQVKDDFYSEMNKVLSKVGHRKEIFILGDMNGRTGKQEDSDVVGKYGEDLVNDNGMRLIDFCSSFSLRIMNGFFPHKSIHKYTWSQPTRHLQSIIDYFIQRQNSSIKTTDVRVFRGVECGSDHFLLKADVVIGFKSHQKRANGSGRGVSQKKVCYNLDSLQQDSVSFLYKLRMASKLKDITYDNPAELYIKLKDKIHEAASEALGHLGLQTARRPAWWSEEVEDLIVRKKQMYHKWLTSSDAEDRKSYARINREVKREVAKLKSEMWERKCEEIGRCMGGSKVAMAWKTIKSLRQDDKRRADVQLINVQDWEEHYSKLLTEDREEFLQDCLEVNVNGEDDIPEITLEEFKKSLFEMKNGKSAGPGDIPIELIKYGPSTLWVYLVELMNMLLLNGQDIPDDWNIAEMISIFKKGDKKKCSNYRGISITSSLGRLYGRILKKRIEVDIQEIEEQSGFRAGRSCTDNIFTLSQLIEKRTARNLATHLIFVDLEKAYDSVPLGRLWRVLHGSGMRNCYVGSICNLYKNAACRIRGAGKVMRITKGLKQGCSLSPTLFKIYVKEALMKWCRTCSGMGIEVGDSYLYHLLFADDQVLVAGDFEDASYMFRKLVEIYEEWGLKINLGKTVYMCIGEGSEDILTEYGTVKLCPEFKYLGYYFTQDGGCAGDVRRKIGQGKVAVQRLNSLLWSSKLNLKVKIMLYKAIVEPITTYGSECWSLTKNERRRLEVVEMDFLRRASRVSRLEHVRNEEIRRRTGMTKPITEVVVDRQLEWYGHMRRMEDYRWPQRLFQHTPFQRKKKGRPKKTWLGAIQEAMTERGLEENAWQDRRGWRLRCRMRR